MRVCLEASSFQSRLTGIGYYSWFLARYLLSEAPDLDLHLFDGHRLEQVDAAGLARIREPAGASRQSLIALAKNIRGARRVVRHYRAWRFRRTARTFDLLHALNYVAPTQATMPILPLIHDISHERHPETHPVERVEWLRKGLGDLQHFAMVNTVSEFSASEIVALYGYPRERIVVTHPGLNPVFHAEPSHQATAEADRLELSQDSFFITVGTVEPRKNHAVLFAAYSQLPAALRVKFPLVVVGGPGWGETESPLLATLRAEGSVRFTGYLNETVLAALYRRSRAFLYPSIYEGFGIPVGEAMASGARLILSDIPVTYEVAGPTALYVDPRDPDAWAETIRSVMEGEPANVSLRQAAMDRSRRFSWEANARRTAELYRQMPR